MTAFTKTITENLKIQRQRYPLMNEEDVVKFVFQGMLGVGHLISGEKQAAERLHAEMEALAPDAGEPLTEEISPDWFRLNLRPAAARGIPEKDIARLLYRSAQKASPCFSRQDVYDLCTALDLSESMKAAADAILQENRLPSHSDAYRAAYRPAYRVLHKDCRNELGNGE